MKKILNDKIYYSLVSNILDNGNFKMINDIEHHGTTRYNHSIRVSYYSYKIANLLKLESISVARAGLLHDFFMSELDRSKLDRFKSTFIHPKYALRNASSLFNLNDLEKDIIVTHMFPFNYRIPKYAESWLVSSVDKFIGTYEFINSFKNRFSYASNYLYLLFIINIF